MDGRRFNGGWRPGSGRKREPWNEYKKSLNMTTGAWRGRRKNRMVYIHSPPRSPAREEEIEEGHEMQKTNEFEDGYSLPTSALTEVISMSSDASGNASIMK